MSQHSELRTTLEDSEDPGREGSLQNQIGCRKTERNRDHRCQTELEQMLERESHQRNGNEYDDWGLDDIDGVRVSLQESGEPTRPVELVTEECDQPEGHSHGNGRIPQGVDCRLPEPVAGDICGASADCNGKDNDRRDYH